MLGPEAKPGDSEAEQVAPAIASVRVLRVTPSKLLPLALGAQLTSLPLCLLVSLRDFLLARDERSVRRRSSRSRFVSFLRHLTALLIAPYENWPQDECESETSSGGDGLSTVLVHASRPADGRTRTPIQVHLDRRQAPLNLYMWTGRGVGSTRVGPARVRVRSVSSALLAFGAAFPAREQRGGHVWLPQHRCAR
jgi:hypothetical protein